MLFKALLFWQTPGHATADDRSESFVGNQTFETVKNKRGLVLEAVVGLHRPRVRQIWKRPFENLEVAGKVERIARSGFDAHSSPIEDKSGFSRELTHELAERPAIPFEERMSVIEIAIKFGEPSSRVVRHHLCNRLRSPEPVEDIGDPLVDILALVVNIVGLGMIFQNAAFDSILGVPTYGSRPVMWQVLKDVRVNSLEVIRVEISMDRLERQLYDAAGNDIRLGIV